MKYIPLLLSLLIPSLVQAHSQAVEEAAIEARQNAFTEIEIQLEQTEQIIDEDNTDWENLESLSKALQKHSQTLAVSFPIGSLENSRANADVWSKPEKFNMLMQQMDAGFQQIYQASQEKDAILAEQGVEQANDTCRACHRSYRSRF
ncbi:cytochrome c [Vibrio sinensis]|uniref:Cytochrome c n=1 Tax=Vibrio sinensis TaxID=2302434 RepID=A0A3A6QWY3_9VIBR|nr:cytochrome c [Vibrio sinensis]RJX66556.1 cytochrome c [Vibrio sinensis]